jgi:hypothetical protein
MYEYQHVVEQSMTLNCGLLNEWKHAKTGKYKGDVTSPLKIMV